MKKSSSIIICVFSLLALIFQACSSSNDDSFECMDPLGCVDIGPGDPLLIGVLQALSGEMSPLGRAQVRGLELALDKQQHTLLGHPVIIQLEDTGCTAEGGANAVLKLIANPQTAAIFGTTCSGAAATASKAMSAAGLTMISGNNSAPFLTSIGGKAAPDWHPGYFRTSRNEEQAGLAAAAYAWHKLGIRTAVTMHDNDIYTMGLTESFRKAFEQLGGKVVLTTAVNKGDTEMLPVLQAVANVEPDLLFFPLFQPEGKEVLLQARGIQQLQHTVLMSDGALIQQSFLDAVGKAAEGMYFVGPARPIGPAVDALDAAYYSKYKENPDVSYYIFGYDAANILFNAIEKAASPDKVGGLHIGRQRLRDAMYATTSHRGISGNLNCNKFGDCGLPAFNVLQLKDSSLGIKGLESNIVHSSVVSQ